jgi:hypothetical protein
MPDLDHVRLGLDHEAFARKPDHQVQNMLITAMLLCVSVGAAALWLNG